MAENDDNISLREYIDSRWKAHYREHELLAKAIEEARHAVAVRLEGMNELRQQITSERGSFITRDTLDVREASMASRSDTRYAELVSRIAMLEKWRDNMTGRLWMFGAVMVILNATAALALSYFRK